MFKSNRYSCITALVLAALMLLPGVSARAQTKAVDYAIGNPYETVNWDTWKAYKGNLHAHSNASDGALHPEEMVEAHYDLGYDILAMTDHGVVNRGWNVQPQTVPLISFYAIVLNPRPMTDARYEEILTGADRGGRGMTDVPFGIELNAFSVNLTHVNGFFADYGQGLWGNENDYETPIAAVHERGGLTHINHLGYWLRSRNNPERATDPRNIAFFGDLLIKYDSCVGIEAIIETDNATRHDRMFWDALLEYVIPHGRNVWGFANSDVHNLRGIDTAYGMYVMPENTVANVRTAMENGTFFSCSRYARTELGNEFVPVGDPPLVTRVSVNQQTKTITLEGRDYDTIEWVAKGQVIATGNTIMLSDYEGQIGRYVRAQLKGPGGICFTQPFITDDGSAPTPLPSKSFFENLWYDAVFTATKLRFVNLLIMMISGLS